MRALTPNCQQQVEQHSTAPHYSTSALGGCNDDDIVLDGYR
jgi:hypothetical protein